MTSSPLDLTGFWVGAYAYPGGIGPTTPFMADLYDEGGQLSGRTIEPNHIGDSSRELEAIIRGNRQGRSVDFTKTYDGASDAFHSIDYVGLVSEDGSRIDGVWSLDDLDGRFEMYREMGAEEVIVEEVEVVE